MTPGAPARGKVFLPEREDALVPDSPGNRSDTKRRAENLGHFAPRKYKKNNRDM